MVERDELRRLGQEIHQAGADLQRMLHSGKELRSLCQGYVSGLWLWTLTYSPKAGDAPE